MITITRSLIHQLRTALRKAGIHQSRSTTNSPVAVIANAEGLHIRAKSYTAALEYDEPASLPTETIWLPAQFLDDCEGGKAEPVTIEAFSDGHLTACWHQKKIQQMVEYDAVPDKDRFRDFPERPPQMARNEPHLLPALIAAGETTDPNSTRYALGNIQFNGNTGKIVATDGRNLLTQWGFVFPWDDAVLVSASKFFTFADLPQDQVVEVGKSGSQAAFRIAPWTIWLPIDDVGRFPKTDDMVRPVDAATSSCRLSASDADFLIRSIGDLPSDGTLDEPVTLDLNGHVVLRGKAPERPEPTELVLTGSIAGGEPIRLPMNRQYLARATRLGFRDFHFYGDQSPVICRDDRRAYLWAVVSSECLALPHPNAVRIESSAEATSPTVATTKPSTRKRQVSATKPDTAPTTENSEATQSKPRRRRARTERETISCLPPIEQARALRESLRDTLVKSNELIRALKRQQKQSKVVATTLASLKQLQVLSA